MIRVHGQFILKQWNDFVNNRHVNNDDAPNDTIPYEEPPNVEPTGIDDLKKDQGKVSELAFSIMEWWRIKIVNLPSGIPHIKAFPAYREILLQE